MEATQLSTDGWMDAQNVVYPYNGVLVNLQEEGNFDTCYNMVEPEGHEVKRNKPHKNTAWFYLQEVPLKRSRSLWSLPSDHVLCLSFVCESFSQRISLIREVRYAETKENSKRRLIMTSH